MCDFRLHARHHGPHHGRAVAQDLDRSLVQRRDGHHLPAHIAPRAVVHGGQGLSNWNTYTTDYQLDLSGVYSGATKLSTRARTA